MELHGIHVPLVTPFEADGTLAVEALAGLARQALADGAAGLAALGTTAEVATLDEAERRTVIEVCAKAAAEYGATLTVGTGGNDTRRTVAALAELAGVADAALVTVPAFTRPGEAGALAHFEQLAAGSPVPLIVYHIPYRTGQALSAAALRRIGALPNVAGVKYAAGGIDQETIALLADLPPDFAVLAGDDPFLAPLLALGATGGILASAHLATARFVEFAEGRGSRELGHRLAQLSIACFAEPNPTVIKGVLHAQGRIPTPDVRLPLLPASPESVADALSLLPPSTPTQ
ncbi:MULTISPECIES: dihydrodipicolinate synthase family protein [unclassified Kitasatospora]|uniref:dihydrodipicolinate synthase family protein n=1 Tax=unclassified Kitasatospora TaxID=2633591 RepID=UPI00070EA1F4|nr:MULTISPECIES: dihydrodipicolinate synthase family protein [unclassified Kitasatospora]KQV19099.1 4-hydroxy-tetrahydrodipicolinate synthase [Kitasatospora sp. Root107]KRB75649.1 4-hydroxy-tetrahydrodipicolinate synthase [Kitasatospora sp. Root187]